MQKKDCARIKENGTKGEAIMNHMDIKIISKNSLITSVHMIGFTYAA